MSQPASSLLDKLDHLIDYVNAIPSDSSRKYKSSQIDETEIEMKTGSNLNENKNANNENDNNDKKMTEQIDNIDNCEIKFYRSKHIEFILKLQNIEDSYEYCQTEHLRMQVLYWALCALSLLNEIDRITKSKQAEMIDFVLNCYDSDSGGFGGNINHDPHLLNTLSAIQILLLLNKNKNIYQILPIKQIKQIVNFIKSLQKEDGSFTGDKWGEVDTRFTYAACNALSLVGALSEIKKEKCISFLIECRNFDGGFGTIPYAESHSGMVFCCVGSLAILNSLSEVDIDVLNWWLCERQVKSKNSEYDGGLNGRPEKLSDTCYSWWVLSAMSICDKIHWINSDRLTKFILLSQDKDDGGISDRPSDLADIYHTFFGIAGLSLLKKGNFRLINPVWALPQHLLINCNVLKPNTEMNHEWMWHAYNRQLEK